MFAVRIIIRRPNNTVPFFTKGAQMNTYFNEIKSKKLIEADYVGTSHEKISENEVHKVEFWNTQAAAEFFYGDPLNLSLITSMMEGSADYTTDSGVTYEKVEQLDIIPSPAQLASIVKYRPMPSADITDDLELL